MKVTRRECSKGRRHSVSPGCSRRSGAGAQAQTTQKRELIIAQGGDISKFDPHFSTSSNDIRVSFNLFDNLISRHPDGKLYPGLATEWKLAEPDEWTFKLRQGVKFHNGDPFTSADAKCEHRADLRSRGEDDGRHRVHDHRPDRGPGPRHAGHPHQEARSAPARAPGVLRRPDRAEQVHRSRWAPTRSTPSPSAPGRSASCPGSRTTRSCWTPIRTTGAAGSTSTALCFGRYRRRRRASRPCSRARSTSSRSFRPTTSRGQRQASTQVAARSTLASTCSA